MSEYFKILNRINEELSKKLLFLPLCEVCYIEEGVNMSCAFDLVCSNYVVCKGPPLENGNVPIVIFIKSSKLSKKELSEMIDEYLKENYPGFSLIDI